MDKLVAIIGPAPSELPFDDLIERLGKEQERITQLFDLMAAKPKRKAAGTKKPKKKRVLKKDKVVSKDALKEIEALLGESLNL